MADFTPTGWVARYQAGRRPDGRELAALWPVESFNEDGDAMVVDAKQGRLCRARDRPKFLGLQEASKFPISVVAAEPGWRVIHQTHDGEKRIDPVVAWLVTDLGVGLPMLPDWDHGWIDMTERGLIRLLGPDDPDLEVLPGGAQSE